jgi:membrane protein DedA with SNARE-associated domain
MEPQVFQSLLDAISSSQWTYGAVFLLAFLDAIIPIVPSETAAITAGVLSASGDLHISLVIAAAAAGACLGDNTAYAIGSTSNGLVGRLFKGDRQRHLERAERALQERGGYLIIIGRFIPGGRTAVTFGSGALGYPWPKFLAFDVVACILWACYAGLVGYFGGKAFENSPAKGILLALAIALCVAGGTEGYRWLRRRSARRREGEPSTPASAQVTGDGADRG